MARIPESEAKRVLVFNPGKKLIGVYQSAFAVAKAHGWSTASIRKVCEGITISYQKLYFRYVPDDINVEWEDLGKLNLLEYDDLCGANHVVYPDSRMSRKGMPHKKKKSPNYPFKQPQQ